MAEGQRFRDLIVVSQLNEEDVIPVHQLNQAMQPGKTTLSKLRNYLIPMTPSPFLIASDKRKLLLKADTFIKGFYNQNDIVLNVADLLDTGILTNGKDFYIFIILADGSIKISQSKTAPQGYLPIQVKLIGGFHTLCANVGNGLTYEEGGETKNHPLNCFVAGDILPQSVWCLNHRPYSEPEGMVYIPSLDFWCDIYLQSGSGANTKSVYQGALTRTRQYVDHVEDMICVKKELLDDAEFAAAMMGSNEMTAVQGANTDGAVVGGAGARVDTQGRRMISIHGVEEGCGSLWQWLRSTSAAGYEGSANGQISPPEEIPLRYGQFWSAYNRTVSDSTGQNLMPFSSAPQSGNKGRFYYMCTALRAGGFWSNSASCGSRARAASGARSSAYSDSGGRGRSRNVRDMAY